MGDEGLAIQLLRGFAQDLKALGQQLQDTAINIAKISTKQDSIEEKLDAGQDRFREHELVHKNIHDWLNELESDRDKRDGAQTVTGSLSATFWATFGAMAGGAISALVPFLMKHK